MATHVWAAKAVESGGIRGAEAPVSTAVGGLAHAIRRGPVTIAVLALCSLALAGCAVRHGAPDVVDRTSDVGAVDAVSPASTPVAQAPLTATASMLPLDGHRVERGDTLYGIAWRYGLDYREIARLNSIEAPYRIFVGQQLVLAASATSGAAIAGGAPVPLPAEPVSRGFEYVPETDGDQPAWQPAPQGAGVATTPYHSDGAAPPDGAAAAEQVPVAPPAQGTAPPFGAPVIANSAGSATSGPVAGGPVSSGPVSSGPVSSGPVPGGPASSGQVPTESLPTVSTTTVAATAALPSAAPAETAAAAPAQAPATTVPPAEVAPLSAPEPATQPVVRAERAASGVGTWRWPAKGTVQKAFGNGNKGIDFKLEPAQPVLAAGGGEVVYAGNGLGGFRHLVIVKHDQRFLSAYSLNRPISVQEGERLASGGIIAGAEPGSAAGTLRFEIRRDGQPVDPASIIGR